jgi:hypothetical protein
MRTMTALVAMLWPQFPYQILTQSDFGPFWPAARLPTIVSDPFPKSRVVARSAASINHVNVSLD